MKPFHPLVLRLVVLLCCLSLVSCGFHLRGRGPQSDFQFHSLYIDNPQSLRPGSLITQLAPTQSLKIVQRREDADVVLLLFSENFQRVVSSYNAQGSVNQFRLHYTLEFQVERPQKPAAQLRLSRDLSFNNTEILAKESEILFLKKDMEDDSANQLLRILSRLFLKPTANPSAAATAPPPVTNPDPLNPAQDTGTTPASKQ